MPRKNIQQFDKAKAILYGVVLGLILMLSAVLLNRSVLKPVPYISEPVGSRVSLGAMEWNFVGDNATKRDDETVKDLRAFLTSLAEKDSQQDCESHYNVIMASSDEKQVLLEYGCPYPNARMFAVNEEGGWRTISPTNRFDIFGVPECSLVNENQIEKTLAPVCVDWHGEADVPASYRVR